MAFPAWTPALPLRRGGRRIGPVLAALLVGLALLLTLTAPRAWAATAAPGGLKVVSTTPTSLKIGWTAVKGAPKYRVQYSTSAKMSAATYERFTSASAELTGLKTGTRYYVKVRVINAGGDNLSPYSKAVSGVPAKAVNPAPPSSAPLRVGSYNVKCFNCTGTQPNERTWWDRRDDLAANV